MNKWGTLEELAPQGWFSQYDIEVLFPVVEAIPNGGVYLEIGTHLGRSLWVARKAADPRVEIWGVDTMEDPKIPGTKFIQGDSTSIEWDKPVDVLFIDANHDYEYVKNDIERFVPFVKEGGIVLFHDYDVTSPGVVKAVDEWRETLPGSVTQTFGHKTSIARVDL